MRTVLASANTQINFVLIALGISAASAKAKNLSNVKLKQEAETVPR